MKFEDLSADDDTRCVSVRFFPVSNCIFFSTFKLTILLFKR